MGRANPETAPRQATIPIVRKGFNTVSLPVSLAKGNQNVYIHNAMTKRTNRVAHGDEGVSSGRGGLFKRAISAGLGTLSVTEGAVRGILKEGKVPQQIIGAAVGSVQKAQKEFLGILGKEIGDFLKQINLSEEARKILDGMEMSMTTTVRFSRKKDKSR